MAEAPRDGGNLPEFEYCLNNGRSDATHEELTELFTVIGKVSFDKGIARGTDGATLPRFTLGSHLECLEGEGDPEPFPGHGEGATLGEYGFGGMTIEDPVETVTRTLSPEPSPESRSCEKREHRPRGWWDDFDRDQPSHPDDCGHW